MTVSFTFVCLNSVNSNFYFSSSCKLPSFKFCSYLRIFAASRVSFFCHFVSFCVMSKILFPPLFLSAVCLERVDH